MELMLYAQIRWREWVTFQMSTLQPSKTRSILAYSHSWETDLNFGINGRIICRLSSDCPTILLRRILFATDYDSPGTISF